MSRYLRLLKDPTFQEIAEKLERRYLGEITNSESHQHQVREAAYQRVRVLREIVTAIASAYEQELMEQAQRDAEHEREAENARARWDEPPVTL